MGIRKRGQSWMVDVSVKGVGRKTATCATREEAKRVEAQLRSSLLDGANASTAGENRRTAQMPNGWTFAHTLQVCADTVWREFNYSQRVDWLLAKRIVSQFGEDTMLCTLTTAAIAEFQDGLLRKGLKPATANRHLSMISTMMRVAIDRGGLQARPKFPKNLKVRNGRVRFMSRDEEAAHVKWIEERGRAEHAAMIIVLLDTGMRMGEFYNLKAQDIDLEQRVIHIWETKADLPRSIPMTSRVHNIMSLERTHWQPNRSVFIKWWQKTRKDLGFADDTHYVPHVCRHTCASRLVQAGVDILRVKQWLGHKDIQMTQRYAHLAPDSLKSAVAALEV